MIAVVNACATAADTLYKTLMQQNVPNEHRGRAMGSWVLAIGTAPSGHLEVGALAGVLGAPRALLINGGILAVANLLSGIVLRGFGSCLEDGGTLTLAFSRQGTFA